MAERAAEARRACAPTSRAGQATARQLPEFRAQVASSKRGSRPQAVLPEEKDVGDLLRRMQTLATQSNLQIRGFKPAPIVTRSRCTRSGRSASSSTARITTSGAFFDRVSKFPRIINVGSIAHQGEGKPTAEVDDHRRCSRRPSCWSRPRPTKDGREERPADAPRAPRRRSDACTLDSRRSSSLARAAAAQSPRRRRPRPAASRRPRGAGAGPAPAPPPADTLRLQPGGPPRSVRQPDRRSGSDAHAAAAAGRPEGVAGLAVAELSVRGMIAEPRRLRGDGPGARREVYIVRPGDRLLDGIIGRLRQQGW